MALHTRTISDAEFASWMDVEATAFFSDHPVIESAAWKRPHVDLGRTWAALDGDEIVATLRTFASELTVPGGAIVAADAVSDVTTRATHRRRGALTGMVTESLAAAVDRGDPVSILTASRWPIYGRYGYGPATESASLTIDPLFAIFADPAPGGLAYTDNATARAAADPIFDRYRRAQPGAITRLAEYVDVDFALTEPPGHKPWKGSCVLRRDSEGQPDGYLRYHVVDATELFIPDATLVVDDLVAASPDAYVALWRLCCELDNVTAIKAANRSVNEPLRWLVTDGRAIRQGARTDFLWVRVLDVPAALSARTYLTEGKVVLEVVDPLGYASGRFALTGGPAGASCTRTHESVDVTMSAAALGTAYLGGVRLRELAVAGQVTEHTTGSLAKADAMFLPEITPWCNTPF
jgi:predicted acetyltransferase